MLVNVGLRPGRRHRAREVNGKKTARIAGPQKRGRRGFEARAKLAELVKTCLCMGLFFKLGRRRVSPVKKKEAGGGGAIETAADFRQILQ